MTLTIGEWQVELLDCGLLELPGEAIGPVFTGWLADRTSSLHAGLAASVLTLFAASLAALCQPALKHLRSIRVQS